jgi:hypothetical protein
VIFWCKLEQTARSYRQRPHWRRSAFIRLLVAMSVGNSFSAHAQAHDIVWVWNRQCSRPINVALRVHLDSKTVFATSLSLCRWERRFGDGNARFQFTPGRPLVWYGYRSDDEGGKKDGGDTTAAGTTLTVDFWQAGGESDAIELGYSVAANDGLHMNSIHLVSPTDSRATTMAPGLVLETWPETKP